MHKQEIEVNSEFSFINFTITVTERNHILLYTRSDYSKTSLNYCAISNIFIITISKSCKLLDKLAKSLKVAVAVVLC